MADVLTREQRRLNMSRIRGSNTKPELLVRSALHGMGFRFRLHDRKLPGKPDIVLKRHCTVVFVNGCFWHGHGCKLSKMPATRTEFWKAKIDRTKIRDTTIFKQLLDLDWNVVVLWECSIRHRTLEERRQTWSSLKNAVLARKPSLYHIFIQ